MNKKLFIEFMEENFEWNRMTLNLLEGIYSYADKKKYLSKSYEYNTVLEDLLKECFGSDLTDDELKNLCRYSKGRYPTVDNI